MTRSLNVLSLFAGIGGLELGLERAGMTVVGQVELDPFCRRVLALHWPDVPRHDDVRTAPEWWLSQERPDVDVVCGGFPCQPVSVAGRRRGQDDERWMWPAFRDVVSRLRPRIVLVENVPGLINRGLAGVVGDLSEFGYDAEWDVVPAAFVGAPHIRRRVFLVAYPEGFGGELREPSPERPGRSASGGSSQDVADAGSRRHRASQPAIFTGWDRPLDGRRWPAEPAVGRVADGVPDRVDRLSALGNAVVPQVAQFIGEQLIDQITRERVSA